MKFYFLLFSSMCVGFISYAQDSTHSSLQPVEIPQFNGQIKIDGIIDESGWQNIQPFPMTVMLPVLGATPTERTEIRLAHDDKNIYVSGKCFTKGKKNVFARSLVRDVWRGDDWVSVQFDSRFDKQNAVSFDIYALGARFDQACSNDAVELGNNTFNANYNMIWDSKTSITEEGWFFEMKIPLFNLRYKKNASGEVKMGLSVTRQIQYVQEMQHYPTISNSIVNFMFKPSIKQPVVFKSLPEQKLLLLTPYISGAKNRNSLYNESANIFYKKRDNDVNLGLDIKAGLTSQLTLDATINPDFAQAEADAQQVNLSRFSLFFPERRLFFQEQAGLFEFNLGDNSQLFYSRRIGINEGQLTPIYGGVRVIGKLTPKTDLGILSMQTAPSTINDSTKVLSENFGVLRLRQKVFNDRSFIGSMLTTRIGNNSQNYNFGVDGLLVPKGAHTIRFSVAASATAKNKNSLYTGIDNSRITLLYEKRTRSGWIPSLEYVYSGKDFNPEAGFVDRGSFHKVAGSIAYGKFSKSKKQIFRYQQITIANSSLYLNADNNSIETWNINSQWRGTSFANAEYSFTINNNYESITDTLDFGNSVLIIPGRYYAPSISFLIRPPGAKKVRFPIGMGEGKFYDGRKYFLSFAPSFQVNKHFEIQALYDFSWIRFRERNIYSNLHTARVRLNFAMNIHLSASITTQYNSLAKKIFTNGRLRYNFRDGHDLFLVWNENFFTDRSYNNIKRPASDQQTLLVKYAVTFNAMSGKK